ncbi:MAG: stage II sporulation protein M [Pseudomonadota bacterium]
MSPLQFEAAHEPAWAELETLLDRAEGRRGTDTRRFVARLLQRADHSWSGERLASLYRGVCEHLALAQSRAYPVHLTHRLEMLTQRAHRLIYRRSAWGMKGLARLALIEFPQSVRSHGSYLLFATLLFVVPAFAMAVAVWFDRGFILHLVDAAQVQQFDAMYGDSAGAIGRRRDANSDWQMFGFYIMHNIGLGFQCFAGGIFAGVGSAFFLVFNGLFLGAVSSYLIASGHAENFVSFVITHGAFELTAIVLAGAAGLRLGHAWLAPGQLTRLEAVKLGAREAIVVVYGVIGMLLVAAAIEAFWSSARWVPPEVKYGVGTACWMLVLAYLRWQGRPAASPASASQERARAG